MRKVLGLQKALNRRNGINRDWCRLSTYVGLTAHIQQASVENAVAVSIYSFLNNPTPSKHNVSVAIHFIVGFSMRFGRRTTRITTLRKHLLTVRAGLYAIELKNDYIPAPDEIKALAEIRWLLDDVAKHTKTLEPQLWQRVETWCNTPWTPKQQLIRKIGAFFGYWIAGTMAIGMSVVGWFAPLFPEPWYVLPVSAALAFLLVICLIIKEDDFSG